MPLRKMKVSEWIRVQDNPIQRDTERHAAKAKHLLTPLSIHAIVYAAELPDGKLVKLDGHTRALMWSRNQMKHPPEVECHVIPVQSMEEAKKLYQTLDSKDAMETTRDKVSGAFNQLNFSPESGFLRAGNIASALRMCWQVQSGASAHISGANTKKVAFDIYSAAIEFSNEVFALDAFESKHFTPTTGITAAFILTVRKHGKKILPFWQSVFADAGEKANGKMDGVQALNEMIMQRRGKSHGGSGIQDIASRAVMAAEKWLSEELLTTIPRPYDLSGYIDHAKPENQLIKAKPIS